MITDIFYKRYKEPFYYAGKVSDVIHIFFTQAAHIVFEDLFGSNETPLPKSVFKSAIKKLNRELGYVSLNDSNNYEEACKIFLLEKYDLWNNSHGSTDFFIKVRLSLIELIFRELEEFGSMENSFKNNKKSNYIWRSKLANAPGFKNIINNSIRELNVRFKQAKLPLNYHNGYLQFVDDNTITENIEEPFWELLKNKKWGNVDLDMKEAIDRRDNNGRDAALYACKALESAIKIISDKKGFTRGNEKGAANYIDNLVSQNNGRFIDIWEADALKNIFSNLRNPHCHGPGSNSQPTLIKEQETWLIESCMSWIKSLIKRS